MNKLKAEKIVNAFGGVIANTKGPFRNISDLLHPKAVIKHAYFVYIEAIIKEYGTLPKDIGDALVSTYSMLDGFLDGKEVKSLTEIGELIKTKNKRAGISEEIIKNYFEKAEKAIMSSELFDEINEFIGAKYKEREKGGETVTS